MNVNPTVKRERKRERDRKMESGYIVIDGIKYTVLGLKA